MCVNITITGTISHSGMLLAAVTPTSTTASVLPSDGGRCINTMLSGPHAFLSANEATSVCLEVPFYCNSDYAVMDLSTNYNRDITIPNSNFAMLSIMVLNPLQAASTASTSLSLVFEFFFKSIELKVPRPIPNFSGTPPALNIREAQSFLVKAGTKFLDTTFNSLKTATADAIDGLRGTVRAYTGLHNPNVPVMDHKQMMSLRNYNNTVDSGVCYERLDPYTTADRIVQEPTFQTSIDEMAISNIISKPQYIGTFTVSTLNNAGTLLFCRPISPYQGGCNGGKSIANNIELLYQMTRAWRGDLNLHIQSSMNNKQNVKLKVIKYYSPSSSTYISYPLLNSVANAPSDLIEFSQGNQVHDISLPFLSRNALVNNARAFNTLGSYVGMYYIYVAQPLVVGDGSPTTCEFNVYISCSSNFQFFGYSTEVLSLTYRTPPAAQDEPEPIENNSDNVIDLDISSYKIKETQSLEVMNKPSIPLSLHKKEQPDTDIDDSRLIPLVDIRPLIRRNQYFTGGTLTIPAAGVSQVVLSLDKLIGEAVDGGYRGSTSIIPGMFHGKQCGLKFKLIFTGLTHAEVVW